MTTKEELESLTKIVNDGATKLAHLLTNATGRPVKALIVMVHFPEDVIFGSALQEAPPQAQMNVIDTMLKHCRTYAESVKVQINTMRHGKPTDPGKVQ